MTDLRIILAVVAIFVVICGIALYASRPSHPHVCPYVPMECMH